MVSKDSIKGYMQKKKKKGETQTHFWRRNMISGKKSKRTTTIDRRTHVSGQEAFWVGLFSDCWSSSLQTPIGQAAAAAVYGCVQSTVAVFFFPVSI
jgi:hypothetical protein